MLNPNRPELEQLIFPDEAAVARVIESMRSSLLIITNEHATPSEQSEEIIQRNQEYLITNLAYESIQQAGVDLSEFVAASMF